MIQAVLKSNLCLINWEWYKFHSTVFVVISLNFFFLNLLVFRCLLVSFTLQFLLNSVLVHLAPLLSQLLSGQEPHGHFYPLKNHPQVLSKNRILWCGGVFFQIGGWTVKNWLQFPSEGEKIPLKSEEWEEVKWAVCPALGSAGSGADWGLMWGFRDSFLRLLWVMIPSGGLSIPCSCSWGSWLSPAGLFQLWQFPAHPSAEESEQRLLVRSAGSTCGMPLITVLIGFLLVPSIFSKQKAGAIYFFP